MTTLSSRQDGATTSKRGERVDFNVLRDEAFHQRVQQYLADALDRDVLLSYEDVARDLCNKDFDATFGVVSAPSFSTKTFERADGSKFHVYNQD